MIKDLTSLKWCKSIYYVSSNVIFDIENKKKNMDSEDDSGTYLIRMNDAPDFVKNAKDGTLLDISTYPNLFKDIVPCIELQFSEEHLNRTYPLQYLIEKGDKIADSGEAIQSHPDIYENDYRNRFNQAIFNYIKNIVRGKVAKGTVKSPFIEKNLISVMSNLPGWMTCPEHTRMSISYVNGYFLKGFSYNEEAATKLREEGDIVVDFLGIKLYAAVLDNNQVKTVTGQVNIWTPEEVYKILLAVYSEILINGYNAEVSFNNAGFQLTGSYMQSLANYIIGAKLSQDVSKINELKVLTSVKYRDDGGVEEFKFIPTVE